MTGVWDSFRNLFSVQGVESPRSMSETLLSYSVLRTSWFVSRTVRHEPFTVDCSHETTDPEPDGDSLPLLLE